MEDGVFAGEALRSGLVLVVAETAQHPQRSADDGQSGCAQAHLGEETAAGLAGLLFGFDLVGQAILLPVFAGANPHGWIAGSDSPDPIDCTRRNGICNTGLGVNWRVLSQ